MKLRLIAVLMAVIAAGLAACGIAAVRGTPPGAVPAVARQFPREVTGVAADSLTAFGAACKCAPGLVVRYIRWGETEQAVNLAWDTDRGAVPLAELEPRGVTLAQVADGSQDAYLTAFARQVAALREPVWMSFAAEANNDTYPWGYRHSSPAAFIAAWRHVVAVFREAGTPDVRWMWVVNFSDSHTEPLSLLWPGRAWVDEAGIDGYGMSPDSTFSAVFADTVTELRRLGKMPVMVTETAATPAAGQARWLRQLAAGVKAYRLAGFTWFDVDQRTPSGAGNDWSIDSDPAALAAFRAAAKEYG